MSLTFFYCVRDKRTSLLVFQSKKITGLNILQTPRGLFMLFSYKFVMNLFTKILAWAKALSLIYPFCCILLFLLFFLHFHVLFPLCVYFSLFRKTENVFKLVRYWQRSTEQYCNRIRYTWKSVDCWNIVGRMGSDFCDNTSRICLRSKLSRVQHPVICGLTQYMWPVK